jgi:transcriptional regulator with XRE-family HTH domain
MEFNDKLQQLRKQKNLTQEELAAELYVSRTAVSKWESGVSHS